MGTVIQDAEECFDGWRILFETSGGGNLSGSTISGTGSDSYGYFENPAQDKFGIIQFINNEATASFVGNKATFSVEMLKSGGTIFNNVKIGILGWSGTADAYTVDPISTWNASGTTPTPVTSWSFLNTPAATTLSASFVKYSVTTTSNITTSTKNLAVILWLDSKPNSSFDYWAFTNAQLERGSSARDYEFRNTIIEKALAVPRDAYLPSDGFRNRITNGDMRVAQRGTSFGPAGGTPYTLDMWRMVFSGSGGQATITQSSDVPTFIQAGRKFINSLKIDVTTADTTAAPTSNGYAALLRQYIEPCDVLDIFGDGYNAGFTLSFWCKATKTGWHAVRFANGGADRSYVAEYYVSQSGVWEYHSIPVTAAASGGTWYTSSASAGPGMLVDFSLRMGSNYHTTAGAWQTNNFYATSRTVNDFDSTSNDFYLTGVQLEAGTTPTLYETIPYSIQLAKCQRFSWVPKTATRFLATCFSSQGAAIVQHFPVPMRTTPVPANMSNTGFTMWNSTLGSSYTTTSTASFTATEDYMYFTIFHTSASPFNAGDCMLTNVITAGNLVVSAEY